jgi:hypothetical protein
MTSVSVKTEDTLSLLAKNEEAIGRLYDAYAEVFPESADFWRGLAKEERSHATWIYGLNEKVNSGEILVDRLRFKAAAISTTTNHTEAEIKTAKQSHINFINALSIANAIEQSLIESKFFDIVESDSVELKQVLHKLKTDTEIHAHKIHEQWGQSSSRYY